jgi:hypothetical protein
MDFRVDCKELTLIIRYHQLHNLAYNRNQNHYLFLNYSFLYEHMMSPIVLAKVQRIIKNYNYLLFLY